MLFDHPPPVPALPLRNVKTFVRRGGRSSVAQLRALAADQGNVLLRPTESALDWPQIFARDAPRILEIGFGMGEASAALAAAWTEHDFSACDVHEAGIGALLRRVSALQLRNLRILAADALRVAPLMLPARSLAAIHCFFPDPWPKKRHHKRRLIQPEHIATLVPLLRTGGYWHCATDWRDYAEEMLRAFAQAPGMVNASGNGFAPRPLWRPLTKFEARGLRLGHEIFDLTFVRNG